ncbi:putative non-ribosomal peptide synthetase [Burkholderia pseudomallei MSHR7504]|nr:putative non-ribosomal peptide synthetase [Burkholderia pseudomallei MSHR7504]
MERHGRRLSAGSVSASLVRGAGRAASGHDRADRGRRACRLCRTESPCEPARPSPERARAATGPARGDLHRSRHRHGRRDAGRAQGGRRIRAARSGLSVGAARLSVARLRARCTAHACASRRVDADAARARAREAGHRMCVDRSRIGCRRMAARARRRSAAERLDAAPSRLRDLYVGLDGATEGGDGRASQRLQSGGVARGRVRCRHGLPQRERGGRRVRCDDVGGLGGAVQRRLPVARARRRRLRSAGVVALVAGAGAGRRLSRDPACRTRVCDGTEQCRHADIADRRRQA